MGAGLTGTGLDGCRLDRYRARWVKILARYRATYVDVYST